MNIDKLHRNQQKVLHVMSQLWAHRNHAISLEQSAAWANTSPAHFHRLYKAVTGETVFKTHQRMRMSQARSELMHRDWPVSRIAQRLGFSGPESFVRAFARHTGTTPGQWRLDATTPLTRSDKDKLMHKVELIELSAMHGLLLPHRGDYLLIGERFGFFATWAAQQAPELVENISWGLYYDDPDSRPKSELRSAVFCPCEHTEITLAEGMQWSNTPAMQCALIEHHGPYSEMHKTYQWLYGEWLPESDHQPAEHPCLEHYVNNPQTTAEADLITHIHLPLQA